MARFGISSHLFHETRLDREHLVHIAAHRFEAVEVFATRSHFDYRDPAAIDALAEWLTDTGLTLHAMHGPVGEARRQGRWVGGYSNASANPARRGDAVAETRAVLDVARTLPYQFLVLHLGRPDAERAPDDNRPERAQHSLEQIAAHAREVGVQVAVEVIPNTLSEAPALTDLVEERLEGLNVGVCLDYGHAHLMGPLADTIETLAGHVVTTHVHDNRGRRDEHLVPFAGTIDWDAAVTTTQKVGYDGVFMLEVGDTGDPLDVLRRSDVARGKLEQRLITF